MPAARPLRDLDSQAQLSVCMVAPSGIMHRWRSIPISKGGFLDPSSRAGLTQLEWNTSKLDKGAWCKTYLAPIGSAVRWPAKVLCWQEYVSYL
jgi:hypothetical protein